MNCWNTAWLVAAGIAIGATGCSRRTHKPASKPEAGLNLRVVANAASVSKVQLRLVSGSKATVSSMELPLVAAKPENNAPAKPIKEATTLLRVSPGLYTVELVALDSAGKQLGECSAVATTREAMIQATRGRLRNALFALECRGQPSPLAAVNRPPQNFEVHFPKGRPNQHESFACGGRIDFCVSAWDADENPLHFAFQGIDSDGCKLKAVKEQDKAPSGMDPTQRRCYQVHCGGDYVGQLNARAQVFDQVWRKGAKENIRPCAEGQSQKACNKQASSRSLQFPLRFVKASMCAPCKDPGCEGKGGGTLAERLAFAEAQKRGQKSDESAPTRVKSGASSVSLMGVPVLDPQHSVLGGSGRQARP